MRDLDALFDPRSVAVVGVSENLSAWGTSLARNALLADPTRRVHLVNRRGVTVLGRPTLTSLRDVDEQVDLVAVAVPTAGFLAAIDDALSVGARAIVAVTAGLSESSAEGREIEVEAVARVRAAGAVLVGPNCMGVVDTTTNLVLASDPFEPGSVALLTQSGNLAIDIESYLVARAQGISRMVSVGNQADVTLAELVRSCAVHAGTRVTAIYAEDLKDGREFAAACRESHLSGTPVVLLTPGRSRAGARGALSHTGALVSSTRVIDAVCRAGAITRVESVSALADACLALSSPRRASGRRVAILTDGGGHGALAADALSNGDLQVPELTGALGKTLREALWERAGVTNPVDLAGIGEQDPLAYVRGLATLLETDEIDAVLMVGWFGGYAKDEGWVGAAEVVAARDIASLVADQPKPVVVHSMFPDTASTRILRDAGIPVYRDIGGAVAAVSAAMDSAVPPILELPSHAVPMTDTSYDSIRSAVMAAGVGFASGAVVSTPADAVRAAQRIGYPVVVKALGTLHKSDTGGVVLDVADASALTEVVERLASQLGSTSFAVDAQVDRSEAMELIAGVVRDPRCGPVLMIGIGGVLTEILDDVVCRFAPASADEVAGALQSLRGAGLFGLLRGRPALDVTAAARAIAALSRFGAAHPELSEVEINPLMVTPTGAVAVDARAVLGPS